MPFDFAARPPEINSALMYSGAGAGPMVAAASAFSSLSAELSTTAASYQSIISQLTGSAWQGPSAAAMAAAAEPYIAWLNTTSGQLQHAASQAIASAAAYETAFSATVPPPVIAANRAQLAMLVATNVLGQNTPAIAANEAQYAEMWAQDAAAMYGYAASSAAAAAPLQPPTPPAENTNPTGPGLQAAAVSNALNSSATTSGLNGVLSSLTDAQGALANPFSAVTADATTGTSVWQGLNDLLNTGIVFNSINSVDVTASWCTMMTISAMATLGHFISNAPAGVTVGDVTPLGAGLGGGILAGATAPAGGGFGGAPVAAGMGQASLVGRLSVPGTWSAAAPAPSAAAEFEGSGWTVAPEEEVPVATVPAGMPSVASAGRGGYGFGTPRYGVKPTVMPKTVLV
jgi:PPE-repeat protein